MPPRPTNPLAHLESCDTWKASSLFASRSPLEPLSPDLDDGHGGDQSPIFGAS
jgi:hypothetical protein